ncbi:GNAT family N-acetyltransferase [Rhodospirillum sp. A1_3_36]|uniref:GNAT family N-acetyltransferase n=1 Tax=Rhodospirillum sp. A1_3_36 TaxID=3391666 RepID=UPI0039A4BB6F
MTRDPDSTRTRLLEAAREEFSRVGPAGARVNRIAERAGVNKERIYGYFQSKEKLFEAVLADTLRGHADAVGPPTAEIGAYMERLYDAHPRDPGLLRLLLWEGLGFEAPDHIPAEAERRALYGKKLDLFSRAMGRPANRETAALLFTLIGIAAWPAAVPQLADLMLGSAADEDSAPFDMRAFLARLAPRLIQDSSSGEADPTLDLRPLTPDDRGHVARIFFCAVHEGARDHYTFEQRRVWGGETVDPEAWRDRLEEGMGFLAERNGEPVGFMTVDETGLVDLAFVLPSMAGQGIGTRLYWAVEDQARALGIQILTTEASKVSKPFFERQGWEVVTEQSVEREGVFLTNYKMQKPL